MTLSPNDRLGAYEIVELIGAGGMGRVYRARDTKLGRDVAIKVLPAEFSREPERLARFEREAKLLASLNHPNIATLHGLEESEGERYLVMELVPGETLAERLKRGPLPADEALAVARQVASALEAAHENGVIHRDVKPANIKIMPDGQVKVLDFGLAKAFAPDGTNEDPSSSPTLSAAGTRAGVILGTAAYMSPEQARGQTVDKRSDIFSFGAVLFEMLAGRPPFRGETVSDVLAAILKSDPDWSELPSALDPRLEALLRGCLKKNPKERRRDIGDVRNTIREVEDTPGRPPVVEPAKRYAWRSTLLWALAASAVAGALSFNLKPEPPQPVARLSVVLPRSQTMTWFWRHLLAISPDGKTLVYGANSRLYVRPLDAMEASPIRGADNAMEPFFSPDGRWLAFYTPGSLMKVPLGGGAPSTLCKAGFPHGASWSADDTIVFGESAKGIFRVPASGGTPEVLVEMDATKGERAHGPQVLPDGKTLLFTLRTGDSWDEAQIVAQSLETGERRVLVDGGTDGRYIPTGHLVYVHRGTILAVAFDPERLEIRGGAVPIVEQVLQAPNQTAGAAQFAFSQSGSLIWAPPSAARSRLAWVSRRGSAELLPLRAIDRSTVYPRLSPDGDRIAFFDATDLWVYDLRRGSTTRLTFGGNNTRAEWTPDGTRVLFASSVDGRNQVFSVAADGSEAAVPITTSENGTVPESVSPDGRVLAYRAQHDNSSDIWVLPLQGGSEPRRFAATPFRERGAVFSPDGRFLAYVSDESGRDEIYLQPFPGPGPKVTVSTGGGTAPAWSPTGRELFYLNGTAMMSVPVAGGSVGAPQFLFDNPQIKAASLITSVANYDVSTDGERFLMVVSNDTSMQLNVVLHWFDELKRLVPSEP